MNNDELREYLQSVMVKLNESCIDFNALRGWKAAVAAAYMLNLMDAVLAMIGVLSEN